MNIMIKTTASFYLFVSILFISLLYMNPLSIEASSVKVEIDGELIHFDQGAMIKDGRTLVPMRKIFEELGADVHYDSKTKTITATRDTKRIVLKIGSKQASINSLSSNLDVPAQIVNNRTLVPLRFISEALGAQVSWDSSKRSAQIITVLFEDYYFFTDLTGNILEQLNENRFNNEFDKLHTNRELVSNHILTILMDSRQLFQSHHTTSMYLNGAWYDMYMIVDGYIKNGVVTGDFEIYVYDTIYYDIVDEFYGDISRIPFNRNLKFSIQHALDQIGAYQNGLTPGYTAPDNQSETPGMKDLVIESNKGWMLTDNVTEAVMHPNKPIIYALNGSKKLQAYHLEDQTVKTINLPLPAERLHYYNNEIYVTLLKGQRSSYWWDGSQEGAIAIVDTESFEVKNIFNINIDPYMVVADEKYFYVTSGSGQWTYIKSYMKENGIEIDSKMIRQASVIKMHPELNRIYAMTTDSSPRTMSVYPIEDGKISAEIRSPYHGTYSLNTNYEISTDGKYIINGTGNIFYSTNIRGSDMTFATKIPTSHAKIAFGTEYFYLSNQKSVIEYEYATFTPKSKKDYSGEIQHLFNQNNELIIITKETPPGSNMPRFFIFKE